MRVVVSSAFLMCAAFSLVGACEPPPGEGEGEGEGEVDFDAFVEIAAEAFQTCPNLAASQGSGANGGTPAAELEPSAFGDQPVDFEANLRASFDETLALDDVIVDAEAVAACIVLLEDCSDDIFEINNPCGQIFVGTRAPGDGCGQSVQCQRGNACNFEDEACGVCAPFAQPGESCLTDSCTPEALCGEDDTCALPNLASGAVCDIFADLCGDGLICVEDDPESQAGTCQSDQQPVAARAGDACTDSCGGLISGLACVNNSCVAVTVVQPNGGACDVSGAVEVVNHCVDSLTGDNACVDIDDDGVGVCSPLPELGDACTGACAGDSACANDICVALPGDGAACISFSCAEGFTCNFDTDICEPPAAQGESCVDVDCAEGLSCDFITNTCAPEGQEGESCETVECAAELNCNDNNICQGDNPVCPA